MRKRCNRFSMSCLKDDLADYGFYLAHHAEQEENIRYIEDQMIGLKAVQFSDLPKSTENHAEDRLIDLIERKKNLEDDLAAGHRLGNEIERFLSGLSRRDRDIIETLWIRKETYGMDRLCEEYYLGRTAMYDLSNRILESLLRIRYGVSVLPERFSNDGQKDGDNLPP